MSYPRVLIVALGRINAADTSNNGLLLRNLFGKWPRENLAQIYSSGDNGDAGFFGQYYQLGPHDRWLGHLFYRLKAKAQEEKIQIATLVNPLMPKGPWLQKLGKRFLLDTGLYELIFRPRLSGEMLAWVSRFGPDIIFAQGYNLAFTWLPLMLAHHFQIPIGYYPTDDWPSNSYRSDKSGIPILSRFVNSIVSSSSRRLVNTSVVRVGFNRYMQEEYLKRYGKEFSVLMHGDYLSRYQAIQPERLAEPDECWIVSTGVFNHNRRPLLHDLDRACEILNAKGLRVRTTVFPVNPVAEIFSNANGFNYIHFEPCPSHDRLVSILRGADILFLPERFDETAQGIRLSVSSKAHLFMYSGRPIVVYSDPVTGIARYARQDGWAAVVDRRDPKLLAQTFEQLMTNNNYCQRLITAANQTANANHNLSLIQTSFYDLLYSVLGTSRY